MIQQVKRGTVPVRSASAAKAAAATQFATQAAVIAAPNGLLRTPLLKKCILPTQAEAIVAHANRLARPTVREGHRQALCLIRAELEIHECESLKIRKVWQCFYQAFKIIGRPMDRVVIKKGGFRQQVIRILELAPHEVHVLQAIGEQADAIALRNLVSLKRLGLSGGPLKSVSF